TPFFNTYHQIDMFFEALYWKIDEPKIRISMAKGAVESIANFRSADSYNEIDYDRLGGLSEVHPLTKLSSFLRAREDKMAPFSALDYAKHLKMDVSQTRQLLMRLSIAGLLSYDVNKEEVTINGRFF